MLFLPKVTEKAITTCFRQNISWEVDSEWREFGETAYYTVYSTISLNIYSPKTSLKKLRISLLFINTTPVNLTSNKGADYFLVL